MRVSHEDEDGVELLLLLPRRGFLRMLLVLFISSMSEVFLSRPWFMVVYGMDAKKEEGRKQVEKLFQFLHSIIYFTLRFAGSLHVGVPTFTGKSPSFFGSNFSDCTL